MTWKCLPAAALAVLLLFPAGIARAQDTTPGQSVSPPQTAPDSPPPAPEAGAGPEQTDPPVEQPNDARAVSGDPLAISSDVVLLRVVGPWKDGERAGFSRVVARVSGGELNLYVQWIDRAGDIAQTAEINGAEGVPQLALAEVRVDAGGEDSAVYFDTPADAQGFRETYVLIIERLGEARFGPATN